LKPDLQSKFKDKGIYSYADFDPAKPLSANLLVYDKFSETNDLNKMVSDQMHILGETANHKDNLFLLSWTLTQTSPQTVGCITGVSPSILDLAAQANNVLSSKVSTAYKDGTIPISLLPNLIYADNCGVFVTDLAISLNKTAQGALP
jgi:hypothetical protein